MSGTEDSPSAKTSTTLEVIVNIVDGLPLPLDVTQVSVVPMIPAGVQVSWPAVPAATGYRVDRRCGSDGYSELTKGALPATSTTFADGFIPDSDMTCVYRVRTISGGQISHGTESSPIKLFAVNVPDTTTVTASLIGKTVLVSWVAAQ